MYYYSCTLIVYKVVQQLIYNLILFLSYSSVFIYLFLSLYGSHLILIMYEVLLVANIRIKLPLILCLSSIITQTLYFLFTIKKRTYLFHYSIKTFPHSINSLPYHILPHHLKSCSAYLILKYQYTALWLFRVSVI